MRSDADDEPGLNEPDAAVWRQLEPVMRDGCVSGWGPIEGEIVSTTGDSEFPRVITRVWLDGDKARLEHADGSPSLITDGRCTWTFMHPGDQVPIETAERGRSAGAGTELAFRRTKEDLYAFGFGTPQGPFEAIEVLGRSAWSFRFAPPSPKPTPMHVIVDAASGLVLRQQFADPNRWDEWTRFNEVSAIPAEQFAWSGSVRTAGQVCADDRAQHDRDMVERARWFREHVTPAELYVRGPVTALLNDWRPNGRFFATLEGGIDAAVARPPRKATRWRPGMNHVDHWWTDTSWDWALAIWDADPLSPDEFANLLTQLGSDRMETEEAPPGSKIPLRRPSQTDR